MQSARKPLVLLAAAMAFAMLAGGSLAAEVRKVDQTVKADKDGLVIVENIAGSIRIEGWDKNEIRITGTLGKDVEELKVKEGGKKTLIEVVYPKNARNINSGADLVIMAPRGSSLEAAVHQRPHLRRRPRRRDRGVEHQRRGHDQGQVPPHRGRDHQR